MSTFTAKIIAELDTSKIPSAIEKIKNQRVDLQNVKVNRVELATSATATLATQVQNALNAKKFTVNINGVKVSGDVVGTAGSDIGKKISDNINKKIELKIDTGKYAAQISSLQTKLAKLDVNPSNGKYSEIKSELEQIGLLYEKLKNNTTGDLTQDATKLEQSLSKVKNELSAAASEAGTFVSKFKINAFDDKLTTWLQKNTKAVKNFGPQIEQLRQKFRSLGDSVTTDQLKEFEAELKAIDSAAAAAGQKGKTFADQFKGAFASITKYVSVSTIIYQAIRAAKQMAQAVYDIDTAMTELKKVTDETATTYDKFLSDAGEKAKQMGVAISDYITSVADFARLGYDFKEAQNLADVANIYNVVGDDVDNIETATQTVISNLTAFGIAASDAITIVDELNSVGNAFAISSGGLGDALTRSASSMAAANNTLEETIGLITAANTVVQDPESVGTAYKIISMRLRAAETELQQAGLDTEGMAESTAKLREEIMALSGVDIMINDDTFKSTYQILDELAAKWGELTDIQQASLTELIAGSRLPDRTAMCA